MKNIYISRNGNQEGPFSEDEINDLLAKDVLSLSDYIWREGMPDWAVLSTVLDDSNTVPMDEYVPESLKPKNSIPCKEAEPPNLVTEEKEVNESNHLFITESDGDLHVYDDRLTITPKGILSFLNRGFQGTKTIYFHSITGIQLKPATGFLVGYLQFTIPGGNESKRGVLAAVSDENTFLFREANNRRAELVKNHIEAKMKEVRSQKPTALSSLGDEIAKLAALKAQGALTEDEFQAAKKRLIN